MVLYFAGETRRKLKGGNHMALQLTQKERQLLQDQKTHEEVCIQKYQQNAQQVSDPQLKQLFQSYAQQEQQHLNTIVSIQNGQVPSMSQGQQGQQTSTTQPSNAQPQATTTPAASGQADAMICHDMLMTEKYVSNAYNTAIFEFTDSGVRQALNHIQKEEQQHGEGIFNYLNNKGMYNVG
jgi:spore coat protein CotF